MHGKAIWEGVSWVREMGKIKKGDGSDRVGH